MSEYCNKFSKIVPAYIEASKNPILYKKTALDQNAGGKPWLEKLSVVEEEQEGVYEFKLLLCFYRLWYDLFYFLLLIVSHYQVL